MNQISKSTARGLALVVAAVFVFALASFALFSAAGQRSASPGAAPTATRTPEPTTVFGPLPTKPPFPTAVPRFTSEPLPFRSPIPEPTVYPPTVTTWVSFRGVQTGFSFLYPAGWSVEESSIISPGYSPDPQVTIYIQNWDPAKSPGRGGIPAGALKIDIQSRILAPPVGGKPFAIGPLQFPGYQFDNEQPSPGVERSIALYFPAGGRQWQVVARLGPPKAVADKNVEIFYTIIRSLRYDTR